MKVVSNDFINLSKNLKDHDIKLSVNNQELVSKPKEIIYGFDGKLFKTIMQQIEFSIKNVREVKDKFINFQYGILVNGNYEYVDMGDFFIKDIEDDKKKEDLRATGYDKMINFMKIFKQSELQLTYPCTMLQFVRRIGEVCGNVELYSTNFFNSNFIVDSDFFTTQEITYRDVLEKVAQVTMTTIFIKQNKLCLCKVGNTVQTLDTSFLSNMVIKEKFGPVNALVLGRGVVEDNIESVNQESILQNGRCEIRFDENEFVDEKRSSVIDSMFSQINGLEYYAVESKNLGFMWLEPCDVIINKDRENNGYKTICLQMRVVINTGTKGEIKADIPETTTTEYKITNKEEKKSLRVERIAKKNEGIIQDLIEENSDQNNKLNIMQQTVDELNSAISDIADVTVSKETTTGKLEFEKINASEPITVKIYPIGENITLLYPRENLYPANNLFITLRNLRFTNLTTNEVFDYELPDDLLYYNAENYDTFYLDYDSQKCYVNKKCKYDDLGNVVLLSKETVKEFAFPLIELTDGDYKVEILKYDYKAYNAYLFARLTSKNLYTSQFATKVEVKTNISQMAQSIIAMVSAQFENYSTTTKMNSAIELKATSIENLVKEEYLTKLDAKNEYATQLALSTSIKQTAKSVEITAEDNDTSCGITVKLRDADGNQLDSKTANITLSGLVKFTDLSKSGSTAINGSNITTGTIDAAKVTVTNLNASNIESGTLSADRISGGSLDLTGKNTTITSTNFSVDKNGNITANGGKIAGFDFTNTRLSKSVNSIYYYNRFDPLLVAMHIMDKITLDRGMINVLDVDNSGSITSADYTRIKNILAEESESGKQESNTKSVNGSFQINANDTKNCVVIKDRYGDLVLSLGLGGINSNFISGKQCVIGVTGVGYNDSTYVAIDGNRGNVSATGSVSQTSLKENKKNFTKFKNALNIIKDIDIYKYNLKTETKKDKKHIGFVIGEGYKYSEEVTSNNNDGVDLYSFVSLCCKAIQELNEKIEILEASR